MEFRKICLIPEDLIVNRMLKQKKSKRNWNKRMTMVIRKKRRKSTRKKDTDPVEDEVPQRDDNKEAEENKGKG